MHTVTTSSPQSVRLSTARLIARHPFAAFVLLALALTWPCLIADALGSWGLIPFRLPLSGPGVLLTLLMGYGPTGAALIVTGLTGGPTGLRRLLGRLLRWRAGPGWYAAVILGTGLVYFAAQQITARLGGAARPLPAGGPPALALNVLVMFLVNGLVNGEEIGWRGFALPRLQSRFPALTASLVLGGLWALFHLPLFFSRGGGAGGDMSSTPMAAFLLIVLAGSVLVTCVYNHTRGSLLFAYLFHAAANTWPGVFASDPAGGLTFWVQAALLSGLALIAIVACGPARLSRRPAAEWPSVSEP